MDYFLRNLRKIYETIVPQIVPTIEKRIIEDKEIVEVSFKGGERPYSAKGVYYIRIADEDRILEREAPTSISGGSMSPWTLY